MSISLSGVKAHDTAMAAAEMARQVAISPSTSQSSARSAEITFYRAALASAKANGLSTSVFATALRELGTGGA